MFELEYCSEHLPCSMFVPNVPHGDIYFYLVLGSLHELQRILWIVGPCSGGHRILQRDYTVGPYLNPRPFGVPEMVTVAHMIRAGRRILTSPRTGWKMCFHHAAPISPAAMA